MPKRGREVDGWLWVLYEEESFDPKTHHDFRETATLVKLELGFEKSKSHRHQLIFPGRMKKSGMTLSLVNLLSQCLR